MIFESKLTPIDNVMKMLLTTLKMILVRIFVKKLLLILWKNCLNKKVSINFLVRTGRNLLCPKF